MIFRVENNGSIHKTNQYVLGVTSKQVEQSNHPTPFLPAGGTSHHGLGLRGTEARFFDRRM